MAISRAVRPTVLVVGSVVRLRELRRKADKSVYGGEVTLQQDSGAQIAVTVYARDDGSTPVVPPIGSFWAVECSVEESREFGASLNYEGPADSIREVLSKAA